MKDLIDHIGDEHFSNSIDFTPTRSNAFALSDALKKEQIEFHFSEIMKTLGLDMSDDSLTGTPKRVAKMYINEIFSGLNPANKPSISVFENKFNYDKVLIEKNINVNSTCEHHFLPIVGKAHVGYRSSGKVIGLSKLNRIVDYYARRPQVQERLTIQIQHELVSLLETDDVVVYIDAEHLCVTSRGISDKKSRTVTYENTGIFSNEIQFKSFLSMANSD
jgi:GTP cyclohydrolase I